MGFYIISGLASMPGFYWREIEGFSAKDWDARIAPDRFNNREVMAHLADWEPMLAHQVSGLQEMSVYVNKLNSFLERWYGVK